MIINIFYTTINQFNRIVELCKTFHLYYNYSISSNWIDVTVLTESDEDILIPELEDMRVNYQYA